MIKLNTVLVIFDYGWSEVDWLLPILHKLKYIKTDWKIISIFSIHWIKVNKVTMQNSILYSELTSISDHIFFPSQYNPILDRFQKIINNNFDVKVIIRLDYDTELSKISDIAFPDAKSVTHPGGLMFGFPQKFNHPRSFNQWEKRFFKHDVVLVDSQTAAYKRFERVSDEKICVVGFPRLDHWWINRLIENQEFLKTKEYKLYQSNIRIFTFYSRTLNINCPPEHYFYVYRSIAEVVFKDIRNFLIIKTHPFENISVISNFFKQYNSSRWMITSLQSMQVAYISDFIISVMSTTILDALAVDKPVVEFSPLIQPIESNNIDKHGRYESTFSLMNLSVLVRNKEELALAVDSYFNNKSDRSKWIQQNKAFLDLCPKEDNASLRAAKVIISLVDQDAYKNENLPQIQYAWTPVSGEKQLFLEYIDRASEHCSLFFQLKSIRSVVMPINSTFMSELCQFFKPDVFIATGTFSEHLAILASKFFKEVHCIEIAADLYQPLSFEEMKGKNNIYIHHSASVLKNLLPDIKGRIMFWLGTNETAIITNKSKTNYPIIEELQVIKDSGIKDSIILINNLRYFQPIITQEIEASGNKERKYPDIQLALELISKIDTTYKCAILGDILIAFSSKYNIDISPAIHACTVSRIFNGNNIPIDQLFRAEEYITFSLSESEKSVIQDFHKEYETFEEPGVGGHYRLWYGLTLFGEEQYHQAKLHFFEAIQRGCNYWNVGWKYAESAYKSGDIGNAVKMLNMVIQSAPNFEKARHLLNKITKSHK